MQIVEGLANRAEQQTCCLHAPSSAIFGTSSRRARDVVCARKRIASQGLYAGPLVIHQAGLLDALLSALGAVVRRCSHLRMMLWLLFNVCTRAHRDTHAARQVTRMQPGKCGRPTGLRLASNYTGRIQCSLSLQLCIGQEISAGDPAFGVCHFLMEPMPQSL